MKKILSLALLPLLLTPAFAAKVTNRPIATVNGEVVLLSEFEKNYQSFLEQQKTAMPAEKMDEAWKKDTRAKILDQMIDDKVLLQEAKKKKVKVGQREFANGVTQVKARFLPEAAQRDLQIFLRRQMAAAGPDAGENALDFPAAWKELEKTQPAAVKEAEATFKKELAKEGIDQKKFEERIKDQLAVVELSRQEVRQRTKTPTDEEVKKLFGQVQLKLANKPVSGLTPEEQRDLESIAKFFGREAGERVRARHILITTPEDKGGPAGWKTATPAQKEEARKKINDIKKQLAGGADFADLARQYSADKGSGANGGDLGFFTRGQMVPTFEKTAFSLPVGKVSEVVESPFGLHIIRVEEKKAASKIKLEDADDDLREYLFRANQQKTFESFVADLRKGAEIKVTVNPQDLPKE